MTPNKKRLMEQIVTTGKIGYTEGTGTTRLAFSTPYRQAVEDLMQAANTAGLETQLDSVGNLSVFLSGDTERKRILIGSHLDTVPGGGMLDGALGVLAGIECLITLRENGYRPRHTLEVVGFTEEEGNVIGGTFGSKAFSGVQQENAVLQALPSVGLTEQDVRDAARHPEDLLCYLELHIEQGGLLEQQGHSIGIVRGIVGIQRFHMVIHGASNHSGTTPMELRDDALVKAAAVIREFDRIVRDYGPGLVGTVGRIHSLPDAVNVIPGRVALDIELRSLNPGWIAGAMEQLLLFASGWQVECDQFLLQRESWMDERMQEIIAGICRSQGLAALPMPSGAGHDAIPLTEITPCGMIFVPSVGGISHSPHEFTRLEDIARGLDVLLKTVLYLDRHELEPGMDV